MMHILENLFDEKIRPSLAQHGGNIEIIDLDNNILYVNFLGGCQGCSASKATLKNGVQQILKKDFSFIEDVIDITDHSAGNNPYM